jgi:hypothetical protein
MRYNARVPVPIRRTVGTQRLISYSYKKDARSEEDIALELVVWIEDNHSYNYITVY